METVQETNNVQQENNITNNDENNQSNGNHNQSANSDPSKWSKTQESYMTKGDKVFGNFYMDFVFRFSISSEFS